MSLSIKNLSLSKDELYESCSLFANCEPNCYLVGSDPILIRTLTPKNLNARLYVSKRVKKSPTVKPITALEARLLVGTFANVVVHVDEVNMLEELRIKALMRKLDNAIFVLIGDYEKTCRMMERLNFKPLHSFRSYDKLLLCGVINHNESRVYPQ